MSATYSRVRSWVVAPSGEPTSCGHCHSHVEAGESMTTVAHQRRTTAQPDHADAVRHCCAGCTERIVGP